MKREITKPCFSNGTEWIYWQERNCFRCCKHSGSDSADFKCSIEKDIFTQAIGYGNEPITKRTWEAVQNADCPFKRQYQSRPKRKSRPIKGQIEIDFNDNNNTNTE